MEGQRIVLHEEAGTRFEGWLVLPDAGSGPGLILGQEIFGINATMRRMAQRYAEEGYVVLVPDLFWRLEPGVELGYTDAERARAFALYERFDVDRAVADIGLAIDALRARPECTGKVGFVGYCLGGTLAYLAAARLALDVAVGYYGVGIEKHLGEAAAMRCPLLLHIAGRDQYTPPPVVERIAQAFVGQPGLRLHLYPKADHGFAAEDRASHDPSATALAYSRTLAALRAALGPDYDLEAIWDAHLACEFATKDAAAALETMVECPYVNHIPTLTGGSGRAVLRRFYERHFIPANPPDTEIVPVSRTVGVDRIVDEFLFCFTHTQAVDWLLPGVAPTGRAVRLPMLAVVNFRGARICHEHIYWDQAGALVQVGLLDPAGLPVAGASAADKVLDPSLPSNTLIPDWSAPAAS